MSKYLVLKELPQGQRVGDTVELNDDEARVFMLEGVEAVRPIDVPPAATASADEPIVDETKTRRRYNRRDLVAED